MAKHFQIQSCNEVATVLRFCCPMCRVKADVTVPTKGWDAWTAGAMVQDAFPDLSADDRERFVSGICGPCFDKMFAEG